MYPSIRPVLVVAVATALLTLAPSTAFAAVSGTARFHQWCAGAPCRGTLEGDLDG